MRAGTGISCWLALLASTTSVIAQQKSPYQSNTRATITSVAPAAAGHLPVPGSPIQPIVYQPIQPVASPPIPTMTSSPPNIAIVVPFTPAQLPRPNNDNFLVRLVGHLLGPTEADWAIPDTPVHVANNHVSPYPTPISEFAGAAPAALPPSANSCCCSYRTYVPLSSYFSLFRFRTSNPLLSTRTRPVSPRPVVSTSPQPRALDNSFRHAPVESRLALDPSLPPIPNP